MKTGTFTLFAFVAPMVACVGLSQGASVSWDGTSSDIVDLTANVASPGSWTTADSVWSTTDEVVGAVGTQASFKAAIGRLPAQRMVAEVNASLNSVFVGGNELSGSATSPYTTLVGFDTSAFAVDAVLESISVTLSSRVAGDTMSVRWFVEAGGSTYISGVVDLDVGSTPKTLTLSDATAIEWFDFDDSVNIGSAIGASVGTLSFSDVDYVGYYTSSSFTADANWHGAWLTNFLTSTAIDPVPIADAGPSYVTWLGNGILPLAGAVDDRGEGDVINTDVVWSIKTSPPGSAATLTKTSTDWANPTANFTPDSGIVGDYTIELTATDAAAQSGSDTLLVQVAADICDATRLADELSIYDVDENCIIDLSDMAAFAAKWMSDISLVEPFSY